MAFPMIETDYKPWASLGGLYQGLNAGAAEVAQENELLKQAFEQAKGEQMFPVEMDHKRALIEQAKAQAEASMRDKTDPLKAAKAKREMADMLLPDMATFVEPYLAAAKEKNGPAMGNTMPAMDAVLQRLRKVDPDSASLIEQSYNPAEALSNYYRSRLQQTKADTSRYAADRRLEGTLGAAELGYHRTIGAAKIAAEARLQAYRIAAEASKNGQNLDPKKIFGQIIAEKMANGEYDPNTAAEALLMWQTAGKQVDPVAPGITVTIDEKGKPKLTPKPTEKNRVTIPPNTRESQADDFNKRFSTPVPQKPLGDGWVVIDGVKVRKKPEDK